MLGNTFLHFKFSPVQLYRWFVINKSENLSPKEKLLHTPEHKSNRLIWVEGRYDILTYKFTNNAM